MPQRHESRRITVSPRRLEERVWRALTLKLAPSQVAAYLQGPRLASFPNACEGEEPTPQVPPRRSRRAVVIRTSYRLTRYEETRACECSVAHKRTKVPTDQEPSPRPRLRFLRSKGTGARKGANAPVRVRAGRAHNLIGQIRRIQVSPLFPSKIRARGAGWDWAGFENVMYQLLVGRGSQPQSSRQTGVSTGTRYYGRRAGRRTAGGPPYSSAESSGINVLQESLTAGPFGKVTKYVGKILDRCRGACPRKSCSKCFHRRLKQRAPLSTPCGARYLSVPHPPRLS